MTDETPRSISSFEPDPHAAHTNGSRTHRRRPMSGVIFGVLIGALLATSLVDRLQWLNLGRIGWWGRPAIAAFAAGMMVGWYRRDGYRIALLAGALAGLVSIWGVYLLVRASVRVLFVERSMVRVIAVDLLRLGLAAGPAGALGAAGGWWIRRGMARAAGARGERRG